MEVKKFICLVALLLCFGCGKKADPSPVATGAPNGKTETPAAETITLPATDVVFSTPRLDDSPPDNKLFVENTNTASKIVKKYKFTVAAKTKILYWKEHKKFSCESTLPIDAKLTIKSESYEKELPNTESAVIEAGTYDFIVEISDVRNCKSIEYGFSVASEEIQPGGNGQQSGDTAADNSQSGDQPTDSDSSTDKNSTKLDTHILTCDVTESQMDGAKDFNQEVPGLEKGFSFDLYLMTSDPYFPMTQKTQIVLKAGNTAYVSQNGSHFDNHYDSFLFNNLNTSKKEELKLYLRIVKASSGLPITGNTFTVKIGETEILKADVKCVNRGPHPYVD
jgi:hypothetical protein